MNKALKIFLVFSLAFAFGIVMWTALGEDPPPMDAKAGNTQVSRVDPGRKNANFIGTWKQEEKGKYHTIYVNNDSTLMIDTNLDTIYRYKYKIVDEKLIMFDGNSKMFMSKITVLMSDSLVFDTFLNDSTTFIYTRF